MIIENGFYSESFEDSIIIPFTSELKISVNLPPRIFSIVYEAIKSKKFIGSINEVYSLSTLENNKIINIVLVGLGDENHITVRKVFLAISKALKKCKELRSKIVILMMDNAKNITNNFAVCKKLCESVYLINYEFTKSTTNNVNSEIERVIFETEYKNFGDALWEGRACAEGTIIARNLTNEPSNYVTPYQLGEEAKKAGKEYGFDVTVLAEEEISRLNMDSFIAVGKGASNPPALIVMKYFGDAENNQIVGVIGKGITYDSGGYSLKPSSSLLSMHNDMGGAAAVIGAMRAISEMKLKINVKAIIAACENKISSNAYVPGDILKSMSGKTIEMLNTDAEGRLTLADAITYAIRKLDVNKIIDIATLTGAALTAVGNKSAVVISNDNELYNLLENASNLSCEKIWRLPLDEELRSVLNSNVADIKNCSPGDSSGGGAIVPALFIREFIEDRPWIHIDMAPVNWLREANEYCTKGATGYGVSLLFNMIKLMSR